MKSVEDKKMAAAFQKCKMAAIKEINICFHPGCSEKSINSHILQKNGMLSRLENDRHLIAMDFNPFRDRVHHLRKVGINDAYSFKCFCNLHDTELFMEIETGDIDFQDYHSLLLFTIRTFYNEKFRKLVNFRMRELLISDHAQLFDIQHLSGLNTQEKLGINDLERLEKIIWSDLDNGTESFVFEVREIKRIELCLSAFYNYDTVRELLDYQVKFKKDKEDVTEIFVNVFPYKEKTLFIMGYEKIYAPKVKGYVNSFFKENEKRLLRRLTNLLLFRCETWVTSTKFYQYTIKECEEFFDIAVQFSFNNMDERRNFPINLFGNKFCREIREWAMKNT